METNLDEYPNVKILKRFKHGIIFRYKNVYFMKISLKKRLYPEFFIFEAFKLWKDKIKKLDSKIKIASVDHEFFENPAMSPTISITIKIDKTEDKSEKDIVEDFDNMYCLFWECFLDTSISDSKNYADIVLATNIVGTQRHTMMSPQIDGRDNMPRC